MENQEFQQAVLSELKNINNRLGTVESDIKTIKTDVNILKTDVNTLKTDVKTLKTDVKTLKGDVNILKGEVQTLKHDVVILKSQTDENTKILQALMYSSEINKADHDRMDIRLAKIEGKVIANTSDIVKLRTSAGSI